MLMGGVEVYYTEVWFGQPFDPDRIHYVINYNERYVSFVTILYKNK